MLTCAPEAGGVFFCQVRFGVDESRRNSLWMGTVGIKRRSAVQRNGHCPRSPSGLATQPVQGPVTPLADLAQLAPPRTSTFYGRRS